MLTDVNFNLRIILGMRRQQPNVDVATSQSLHLRTMPGYFYALLAALPEGEHSPGVLMIPQLLPIGAAIEAMLVVWSCSTHEEWRDRFEHLPF